MYTCRLVPCFISFFPQLNCHHGHVTVPVDIGILLPPAMEMTREATERLQKRQERLRKRQEGPADPRFRQQRLRKLSLRQRSRSPLSESQQRRDDRLSRRRERERKRRLRKQQRNERYAWGGVGRETELGGLLRLWRPNQRKERLA